MLNINLLNLNVSEGHYGIVRRVERICPKHGKYTALICGKLVDGEIVNQNELGCSRCRDEEYQRIANSEYEKSIWLKAFADSGIPAFSKENKVNEYKIYSQEQVVARNSIVSWVKGDLRNILFAGKTRTGKTHLLVGALRGAALQGNTIKYILESDLVLKIKDTYTSKNSSEYQIQQEYSNYDYLVIDEVGRATGTDKDKEIIRNLIIKRFNNKKSTAISSNLKMSDFNEYFGDVVFGKFKVSCQEINCVWESYEDSNLKNLNET
ncbi:MAG: ATP-binding protein [Sphaerochaetaceae bacterium]|nr:ATP-binding protein [Sphaerochaetaceae bacterium]